MIEAVNAAVTNAQALRGNAEAIDAAHSFAANPDRIQQSLPQAPYVSPYIHMDVNLDKAVLQIRDGETGDVVRQFPSEQAVALQARNSEASAQSQVHTPGSDSAQQANVAAAQAAAAALAKGAQAAQPQVATTVVTSA
jgi:hypothetical protein